ncbi:MAG: tetratricopeptide repeat-containing sensor histidine kinase [Aurantibacter sp.]
MKSKTFSRLCLLACLLLYNISLGQNQEKIDSLKSVLKSSSTNESKVDISLELHREYSRSDTITSLKYLQDVISISKKINDKNRLIVGYLAQCNYYWKKGNLNRAKEALELVEEGLSEIDNKEIEGKFLMEKAIISHNEGQYSLAITNYLEAKKVYEIIGDLEVVAKCHTNIGGSYWELNQPDEALKNYLKAMEILETLDETNEVSISRILGNIGLIYRQKNEYQKALVYYEKSLALNRKLDMKMSEAINLQNIGSLYNQQRKFEKSLPYFQNAKKVATSIGDEIGVLYANHSIGNYYFHMGQFSRAVTILKSNLELAEKLNNREEVKNLNRDIAEAYEKSGFFEKALKYRKTYELWKDSLINETHLEKVKELELSFETAKKDKEITVLTKENELQEATAEKEATLRNALVGGIVSLGIIGLLFFNTMRQRLKNQKLLTSKNEEINKAKLSEELQTLEMKALRAQMNPHFLFNSLNSINTMILNDEPDNASRYLSKFSKLVRLMLENSEQSEISLKDELETLEAYIQLEAIRFNNKMDYKIDVDSGIDQEDTFLPSMVLQPFVENAIWHGLLHKNQKGQLTIDIKEDGDNLLCSVIDNGVGREKSLTLKKDGGLKKKSMGIKITTDRLKLLTKQKIKDVINIIDLKDNDNNALGTRVNIQIPLS